MKYRKKPVIVEVLSVGEIIVVDKILQFVGWENLDVIDYDVFIVTLEGNMKVSPNDYIIKGVKGEFYPCKKDIFESTYEKVVE
jgi:hypothetical protein